jgi:cytochrome P450
MAKVGPPRGNFMSNAPRFEIHLDEFWQDPYPVLARLRAEVPIAFVPQLNGTVFARRDDIVVSEKLIDVFSSHQPGGLMNRLMGQNMMRKDGAAHMAERKVVLPGLSPRTVKDYWIARFQVHADRLLANLIPSGQADLVKDYAMPLSGECLKDITGLTNITWQEIDAWSQAMIDGIANYTGDQAVEAKCHAATAAIDAAIDDRLALATREPDQSMLSLMLAAGMNLENVRANIKLAISGGQNEPRDAIAGAVWALLTHRDQLATVLGGEVPWLQVFEEYIRWMSPIGMIPRRVAKRWSVNGIDLEPEDRVFFLIGSANRDEAHFQDAARFDITRDTAKSIAFGAGPHFCVGAWASRAIVADVPLPAFFAHARRPRLNPLVPVQIGGWAFRGLLNLPVAWD